MIELDPVAAHATARIFRSFGQIISNILSMVRYFSKAAISFFLTIKIRNGTSLANRYYFPQ